MASLQLLSLPPSPNNSKVRVALGYKELPYEELPQSPEDRALLLEKSGQPLTPVLLHGATVLFDSAAILRYLDANLPGPRLFPSEMETLKKVETWESFGRYGARDSLGPLYGMAFGRLERTPDVIQSTQEMVRRDFASVEDTLRKRDWLVGEQITAADVSIATLLIYQVGLVHPAFEAMPFLGFIGEHFELDATEFAQTRAWVRRVAAYDRWLAPAFA